METNERTSGLQILIVGGSIGGLSTAIALKGQGHCVKVFEQASLYDAHGAGITIFPNALAAIRKLGIDISNIGATKVKKITRYQVDASANAVEDLDVKLDQDSWVWHNTTYNDLLRALRERIQDPKLPGPKAEIHTGQQVIRVDSTNGVLYFADGSQARGHVVIGADGVHSVCRGSIPHGNAQRFRIDRGVYRAVIPREKLAGNPQTAKFIQNLGQAFCYNFADKSLLVWPSSEHENICVKFLYEDVKGFKSLCKDWREPSSKSKLLRLAQGFPDECIELLNTIESNALQDQPIWDMDPLSNYHHHHLVLMGDAAHPMPPYCGQRVAMALEDALALSVLLERNVPVAEIEDRLKLYSGTRGSRAAAVQQFVRGLSEVDIWGGASGFDATAFRTYILGHDEHEHMAQTLSIWKMQQTFQLSLATQARDQAKPVGKQPVARPSIQPTGAPSKKSWSFRLKSIKRQPLAVGL